MSNVTDLADERRRRQLRAEFDGDFAQIIRAYLSSSPRDRLLLLAAARALSKDQEGDGGDV